MSQTSHWHLKCPDFLHMKGYLRSPTFCRRHLGIIYTSAKKSTRYHEHDSVVIHFGYLQFVPKFKSEFTMETALLLLVAYTCYISLGKSLLNEPPDKKICLWGFGPGLTQISLNQPQKKTRSFGPWDEEELGLYCL